MTAIDPYRTLGLTPGASQVEIKRAYRHLAKLYHPDSAGGSLGRFLAIQAAYEALIDERGRGRGYRRSSAATRPPPPPAAPWQADASRARAAREANRARTRRPGPASGGPAGSGSSPRPGGPSTASPGSTADRARTAGGPAAADGPDPTSRRRSDPAAGSTGTGPSATGGTAGRRSRRSRGPKATIGSTSYDGADKEPFDPAWEGATWYGAGSGTYWTLNPKEYADPRKHGPEYLARSRRGVGSTAVPGGPAEGSPAGGAPDASPDDDPRAAGTSSDRGTSQPPPSPGSPAAPARASTAPSAAEQPGTGAGPIDSPGRAGPASGPPPVRGSTSDRPSASASAGDGRWDPTGAIGRTATAGAASAPSGPPVATSVGFVPPSSAGLARTATTLPGRILLAVLGWIPIGVGLAIVTELMPACLGSSLVCADPLKAGIWPIHLLIIGLLASLPRLALIAAYGSGAFLAVGLLATPVLIAIGGAQTPDGTAAVLRIVLAAAWLGGIWIALSGRVELPPWRGRRVR